MLQGGEIFISIYVDLWEVGGSFSCTAGTEPRHRGQGHMGGAEPDQESCCDRFAGEDPHGEAGGDRHCGDRVVEADVGAAEIARLIINIPRISVTAPLSMPKPSTKGATISRGAASSSITVCAVTGMWMDLVLMTDFENTNIRAIGV